MKPRKVLSFSSEETEKLGREFASDLSPSQIIAIQGDLGAGKTTFIKGIATALLQIDPSIVNSPTFTYLNIYNFNFYHFDLYRIANEEQFFRLGFSDYLNAGGLCCIEWPERINNILPKETIWVTLSYQDATKRLLKWA